MQEHEPVLKKRGLQMSGSYLLVVVIVVLLEQLVGMLDYLDRALTGLEYLLIVDQEQAEGR